jgi:elongation factor Ts
MTKIPIEDIRRLREQTGVGITDAKKALVDSNGDFDKALEQMRRKGLTKAAKSAEREARSGLIGGYVHDGRIGVLLEVNCETDFVAKTDEFKELVKNLSLHIAASEAKNADDLMAEPYVKDPNQTVGDHVKQHIAKLGENVIIRRFERYILGEVE